MNRFLKLGFTTCLKKVNNPCQLLPKCVTSATVYKPASRSVWHMSSRGRISGLSKTACIGLSNRHNHTGLSHSSGEKDLVEFLQSEIVQEKKSMKMRSLPAELDGFAISSNQAELTFTKKSNQETVTVSMNVNHSVDMEEVGDDGDFAEEMKSRPSFDVEVQRSGKTLCFTCSYTHFEEGGDKDAEDNFQINEVTYFEGDHQDHTYSVAADLLDENLYDLFMIILSEKGITKKFVDSMSDIATSHEHSQYIHLLENVRKFASS